MQLNLSQHYHLIFQGMGTVLNHIYEILQEEQQNGNFCYTF